MKLKIAIDNMGSHGEGVGRVDGFTVFVEGALPGEEIEATLYKKEKRYGKARLLSIFKPSPDRVVPPCPVFDKCGGCQIMHLSYQEQLKIKYQRVVDAFNRIGKLENVQVLPCLSSPSELNYRNKIQTPVKRGNRGIKMGFYARSTNILVDVESCHIHCPIGESVYKEVRVILQEWDFCPKHVIIKSAVQTEEVMVLLVTNDECSEIAQEILGIPHVKGVIQNSNYRSDNVVLGDTFTTLAGDSTMTDILCGLKFKVSAASFFQVNPKQAEALYEKALELADLKGTEKVLDAYCGVGTLSLLFAKHAAEVIGVECVKEAVRDAQENASINGIRNVAFHCANSEDFVGSLEAIDLVLLNPPRKGCEAAFLEGIKKLRPEKVIYISCDPATLARDLAILCTEGYQVDCVQPFDMFPQTAHVETVVKLSICLPH